MASRDLAASKVCRFLAESKLDSFSFATKKKFLMRPHKVGMTILFLEILSLRDVFISNLLVSH